MQDKTGPSRRTVLAAAAFGGLGAIGFGARAAEPYPSKPIRMVNSSPPGSSFDAIGRAACVEAQKKLGQTIVMEYKPGAGGVPAYVYTKHQAPDGYSLVVLSLSTIRQPILQDVGYSGVKDFTWIAGLAQIDFCVIVPADSPVRTWAELLAWTRAHPKTSSYGCPAGLGNSAHQIGSQIAVREKLDWNPIPYKASNDCMIALLSRDIAFAVDTLISATAYAKSGKVRILAMATAVRSTAFPSVPTLKELGYDLSWDNPVGVGGPAGMAPEVVRKLQDAFKFATEQPSFIKVVEQGSLRPWYMSSKDFQEFADQAEKDQTAQLTRLGLAKKA